ncbi:MAG: hypothetical protein AAF702_40670 [Chloroflexota bacterium]
MPFKAYTYTLFFPGSLIWWGIAATLFVFWLASYLTDRSFILQPHIWLLQFAVHQPGLYPLLLSSASRLQQYSLESELLKRVIEHERSVACSHLGNVPSEDGDRLALHSAVGLTKLLVQLYTQPVSGQLEEGSGSDAPLGVAPQRADVLHAAVLWYEALLLISILNIQPQDNQVEPREVDETAFSDTKSALLNELGECAKAIWDGLSAQGKEEHHQLPDLKNSYTLAAFADDLYLTCCSQPELASHLLTEDEVSQIDQFWIQSRLAQSVSSRRTGLERLQDALYQQQRPSSNPLVLNESFWDIPKDEKLTDEELGHLGNLATYEALYTAYLGQSPDGALGYLDAVEMVRFTQASVPQRYDEDRSIAERIHGLVSTLPNSLQYRLCAALQHTYVDQRHTTWLASPLDHDELVLPIHFDLAYDQAATLIHASGPPPVGEEYTSREAQWVETVIIQVQKTGPFLATMRKHTPGYVAKAGSYLINTIGSLPVQGRRLYTTLLESEFFKSENLPDAFSSIGERVSRGVKVAAQWTTTQYSSLVTAARKRELSEWLTVITEWVTDGWKGARQWAQAQHQEYIPSGKVKNFCMKLWELIRRIINDLRKRF